VEVGSQAPAGDALSGIKTQIGKGRLLIEVQKHQ
jgi:hypothetical protein